MSSSSSQYSSPGAAARTTRPIGDGLKAIGICLVVYGVVAALADLIKGEQNASERTETKSPRKRKSSNRKEDQP